jgi:hypothetical protein
MYAVEVICRCGAGCTELRRAVLVGAGPDAQQRFTGFDGIDLSGFRGTTGISVVF